MGNLIHHFFFSSSNDSTSCVVCQNYLLNAIRPEAAVFFTTGCTVVFVQNQLGSMYENMDELMEFKEGKILGTRMTIVYKYWASGHAWSWSKNIAIG